MNDKKIYENRAVLQSEENSHGDVTNFDCCDETLIFAMKDKEHEFSIGLQTILHCLWIAEKEGYVLKLPGEWWINAGIY